MIEMHLATTNGQPSRNVHSHGYDPDSKTLAICYLAKDRQSPGPTYHYENVEPHHHAEMSKPEISTGSYVHQNIIKGGYKFQKQ